MVRGNLFVQRGHMRDRQRVIDGVDRLLHRSRNRVEVARIANLEISEAPRPLHVRKVVNVSRLLLKVAEFYVLDDADHFVIILRLVVADDEVPPDRITGREQVFGHAFADDSNVLRRSRILRAKGAPR